MSDPPVLAEERNQSWGRRNAALHVGSGDRQKEWLRSL